MNTFLALLLLLVVARVVWEIVFRPAVFAERMTDPVQRAMHAAWIWLFSVGVAGLSPVTTTVLKLPGWLVLAWVLWHLCKPLWAAFLDLFRPRRA